MKKTYIVVAILALVMIVVALLLISGKNSNTQVQTAPISNIDVTGSTTAPTGRADKTYKLSEVSMHNKPTDCWMVIGGKVIDATSFIASGMHNQKIIQGCGIDATTLYNSVPKHKASGQVEMSQLTIGTLSN